MATGNDWFAGLLGKIQNDGVEVETAGGLNFVAPLSATLNESTGVIDVEISGDLDLPFNIIQNEGVDQPVRGHLNFLGFDVDDDAGNDALKVRLGEPTERGQIPAWETSTGKWVATRELRRNALGTTITEGLRLFNATDATVTDQVQRTPSLQLSGAAWDDDGVVTRTVDFDIIGVPIDGNTPSGELRFYRTVSGIGTDVLLADLDETALNLPDASQLSFGGARAVSGSGGTLTFGDAATHGTLFHQASAYHMFADGPLLGDAYVSFHTTDGVAINALPLTGASYVAAGTSVATAGVFRTGNAQGHYGRTTGGANVALAIVGADDGVHYGDANATNATIQSAGQFAVLVGANTELTINGTTIDGQNNQIKTTGGMLISGNTGFFGAAAVAQPADQVAFTDNIAGTLSRTLAAVPDPADAPVTADNLRDDLVNNVLPKIRDALSSLADGYNDVRANVLRPLGLMA